MQEDRQAGLAPRDPWSSRSVRPKSSRPPTRSASNGTCGISRLPALHRQWRLEDHNLPNSASEEDVARAYRLAWELGCLGITVFRDGAKASKSERRRLGEKSKSAGFARDSGPGRHQAPPA